MASNPNYGAAEIDTGNQFMQEGTHSDRNVYQREVWI
jgi:hypothetical protein